jgi:hypothetical protein
VEKKSRPTTLFHAKSQRTSILFPGVALPLAESYYFTA